MLRTFYAVGAAAIVAAILVALPSLSPPVEARVHFPGAKSDRADMRPLGRDCSQRAWPYYEVNCERDARRAFGEARQVRIVSADQR